MTKEHVNAGLVMPPEATACDERNAMRRIELLIAPRDMLPAGSDDTLVRCVGQTLNTPQCMHVACGACQIVALADSGLEVTSLPGTLRQRCVTEGWWPEPLGLRLALHASEQNGSWTVESDRYGIRPIYYGFDRLRRPVVSTRPEVVAALIDARLSAQSLAEHLLVGFNLDHHSPFEGVYRLRPQERLSYNNKHGFSVDRISFAYEPPGSEADVAQPWMDAIMPTIIEAFERGDALELSGGVDSRLVLAIGLAGGVKPRLAFTLGQDDHDDVRIARLICERFGIDHVVLPVEIDRHRIAADGLHFVMQAGFAVNACSYAWLPGVFRRLSSRRFGQIGGGGGECACGFYYSPFDALCRQLLLDRLWVRTRLFNRGVKLAEIFGREQGHQLASGVADSALHVLRAMTGAWRARSDEFYLAQRVPNAGGPVLSASACWYQPLQPLLHKPYIEWGRALTTAQRADRRIQLRIIHQLNARLGKIPYCNGRRFAPGPRAMLKQRLRMLRSAAGKVRRRLNNQRAAPDLGAANVAEALVKDESVRRSLRHLAIRNEVNLRSDCLDQMMSEASAYEHEVGALISAAWAGEAAEALSRQLRPSTSKEQMRCAA